MPGIDEAERALELVDEAWARFDVEGVITHLSTAIRGFTAADEKCRAAMACVQLGEIFANALGNIIASRVVDRPRLILHRPRMTVTPPV